MADFGRKINQVKCFMFSCQKKKLELFKILIWEGGGGRGLSLTAPSRLGAPLNRTDTQTERMYSSVVTNNNGLDFAAYNNLALAEILFSF